MRQPAYSFESIPVNKTDALSVRFLYNTFPGRLALKLVIKVPVSKLAGYILSNPASRFFIKGFIRRNSINMDEYADVRYESFNDFFIRDIKDGLRPFPNSTSDLAAPCDGKLTVYPISADSIFSIKQSNYSVDDLLQCRELADEFSDGVCLIYRLSPDDYHRYCYIDDGEVLDKKRINGVLHAVRPIAYRQVNVFCRNSREYTIMQTMNFGKVVQMEIGALFVGRITNHNNCRSVTRGAEKGMFQFGGSTVVMLFQKGAVTIDDAIYENTRQDMETIVRMGYKIGTGFIPVLF